MPPRRDPANNNRAANELAAIITQQLAAVIPQMVTQISNNLNATNNSGDGRPFTVKHFNSCNPLKFYGSEGATGLLQWFESMESTLNMSECPNNLKTKFATSVFQKRALTWWNAEKRTRGMNAALALTWDQLKEIMIEEFCPKNEMKKLESELWDLAQDSGENEAYTNRFHELCILVPHMVTPLSRKIDRYIGGLPQQVRGTVMGSNPTTLEAAIRLNASLTDDLVKSGVLFRKGEKRTKDEVVEESDHRHKKHKTTKNLSMAIPATPITQAAPSTQATTRKPYTGSQPLCGKCQYHHPTTSQCRLCTKCGRFGHLVATCRMPSMANAIQTAVPANTNARVCYGCGAPDHFKNNCPKLQTAKGRVFVIGAHEEPTSQDDVNSTG